MWRKMMRSWLVGAVVTVGVQDRTLRAETGGPADNDPPNRQNDAGPGVTARLLSPRHAWTGGEPPLDEVLADPVVGLVMKSDGVSHEELLDLLGRAQARLGAAVSAEDGAPAGSEAEPPI